MLRVGDSSNFWTSFNPHRLLSSLQWIDGGKTRVKVIQTHRSNIQWCQNHSPLFRTNRRKTSTLRHIQGPLLPFLSNLSTVIHYRKYKRHLLEYHLFLALFPGKRYQCLPGNHLQVPTSLLYRPWGSVKFTVIVYSYAFVSNPNVPLYSHFMHIISTSLYPQFLVEDDIASAWVIHD